MKALFCALALIAVVQVGDSRPREPYQLPVVQTGTHGDVNYQRVVAGETTIGIYESPSGRVEVLGNTFRATRTVAPTGRVEALSVSLFQNLRKSTSFRTEYLDVNGDTLLDVMTTYSKGIPRTYLLVEGRWEEVLPKGRTRITRSSRLPSRDTKATYSFQTKYWHRSNARTEEPGATEGE